VGEERFLPPGKGIVKLFKWLNLFKLTVFDVAV
jgi:hypothetical protein